MKVSVLVGLVLGLATVGAQASPWTVKVGASQVSPDASLKGFDLDVSDEINLTGSIEYELMPNVIGEVLLAVPFQHDVEIGGKKAGSFKHLPPTVSVKYNLPTTAGFTPYVGAGLNYTFVFDEDTSGALAGKKLKGDNSFGFSAVVGASYQYPNSPWGVALDVRYINIESDLTLDNASLDTLTVDPTVVSLSASYKY